MSCLCLMCLLIRLCLFLMKVWYHLSLVKLSDRGDIQYETMFANYCSILHYLILFNICQTFVLFWIGASSLSRVWVSVWWLSLFLKTCLDHICKDLLYFLVWKLIILMLLILLYWLNNTNSMRKYAFLMLILIIFDIFRK